MWKNAPKEIHANFACIGAERIGELDVIVVEAQSQGIRRKLEKRMKAGIQSISIISQNAVVGEFWICDTGEESGVLNEAD